jgi:3-hydroxybutyryl-CoA dehydrogenase
MLICYRICTRRSFQKKDFLKLAVVAPKTKLSIFYNAPSQFAESTGRPAQQQLHFANQIWKHNTAEIMGHPDDSDVFDTLVAFAKSIGMVALH